MAISRIDFAALPAGSRLVRVVLVAGVGRVFTPATVHPTITTITAGVVDPLWWPGGSVGGVALATPPGGYDPVRECVATEAPLEVTEAASDYKNGPSTDTLTVELYDDEPTQGVGWLTAELDAPAGATRTAITADVLASDVTANVLSVVGFAAAPAVACLGRETVIYGSTTATTLATLTRGAYGSTPRLHRYNPASLVRATAGQPTSWRGRLCTVWLCAWDGGNVLTDPTCIFAGVVGQVHPTSDGARWQVAVVALASALATPLRETTVRFFGYQSHDATPLGSPLTVFWTPDGGAPSVIFLDTSAGSPSYGGWHRTREDFLAHWNLRAVAALGTGHVGAEIRTGTGQCVVFTGGGPGTGAAFLEIDAAWDQPPVRLPSVPNSSEGQLHVSTRAMPPACLWLGLGTHVLPEDFARLPAPLSYALGDALAQWGLIVHNPDAGRDVTLAILATDATDPAAPTLDLNILTTTRRGPTDPPDAQYHALLTQPATGRVALTVTAPRWDAALQVAFYALADYQGLDLPFAALIDFDALAAAMDAQQSPLPARRTYAWQGGDDPVMGTLLAECRRYGLTLVPRFGRLAVVRLADVAGTEATRWTLTDADVIPGDGPAVEVEPGDGLVTDVRFTFAGNPDVLRVHDEAATSEYGPGETLDVDLGPGVYPPDVAVAWLIDDLARAAQTLAGPWRNPFRRATLHVGPAFLAAQPGDRATLSHFLVRAFDGAVGVAGLATQVLGRHVTINEAAGEVAVALMLRIPNARLHGYAPEAVLASIAVGTATLVLSTAAATEYDSAGFGPSGVAPDTSPAGVPVTDGGASWFVPGDVVELIELDTPTPAAPFTALVVSVSGATVTLDAIPGGAWEARAALGNVLLAYRIYTTPVTAHQQRYAFTAASTGLLNAGTTPGDVWAA